MVQNLKLSNYVGTYLCAINLIFHSAKLLKCTISHSLMTTSYIFHNYAKVIGNLQPTALHFHVCTLFTSLLLSIFSFRLFLAKIRFMEYNLCGCFIDKA